MKILYLEPFDGGSHAAFTRALTQGIRAEWTTLLLPGRHWKWRMRASAAHFALAHGELLARDYDLVVASAFLPLAELVGLAPSLAPVPRVLYFHENQLAYPVRDEWTGERDRHYGLTQMSAALAATRCVFNSAYNRDSFLAEGARLLGQMPKPRPPGWVEHVASKSLVLPVPVALPDVGLPVDRAPDDAERALGPIVLWNFRWEHDKGPDVFFAALDRVVAAGVPFRVAVCGESYREVPPVFAEARERFASRLVEWGHVPDRADYWRLLERAQLVVSTARHEFFGVAVLEATHAGAFPLVPDRLAYPELYPDEHRYASDDVLAERLIALCRAWSAGEVSLRGDRRSLTSRFSARQVLPHYEQLFGTLVRERREGMVTRGGKN